ncbi:unnamed protein product [Musa textilis]
MASRPDRLLGPLARDGEDSYEPPAPPFLLCPPPPPPPPPPSQDHPTLLPALPVALASLLTAAVVVIFITIFIYRRRRRRRRLAAASTAEDPGPFENGGGEVDHHVWYIRTTGLDESTIGAITAWAYKAADGVLGDSPADCAVCLSEFRDGELLRLLPKCGHAFHVSCIDTWLRSHVNCPLCRAPIVAPTSAPSGADPRTITPTFSSALSSPAFSLDGMDPNSIPSGVLDSNQIDGRQLGVVKASWKWKRRAKIWNLELEFQSWLTTSQILICECLAILGNKGSSLFGARFRWVHSLTLRPCTDWSWKKVLPVTQRKPP